MTLITVQLSNYNYKLTSMEMASRFNEVVTKVTVMPASLKGSPQEGGVRGALGMSPMMGLWGGAVA